MNFDGSPNISIFRQTVQRYLFAAPLKRSALILVLVLFAIDVFFIGVHALLSALKFFGYLEAGSFTNFKVTQEGGIPEIFNYFKLCLASVVLMLIYRCSRIPIYLILALIFTYAFLDDAFTLHERLSLDLAEALALPDMWRQRTYTQPLYFAVVAGISAPILLVGWFRAGSTHRRHAAAMIASLCALAFFAVFVDFVHSLVSDYSRVADKALALVEDGGEMLAVTLSCWVALSIHSYVCLTHGSAESDLISAKSDAIN